MNPASKEVGFGYAPSMGGDYNACWGRDFGTR
jgi:hypothetical protein